MSIFCFFLVFAFMGKVSLTPVTQGTDPFICSNIIMSCQTLCQREPNNFVRWSVAIHDKTVQCQLYEQSSTLPSSNTDANFVVFDVNCCNRNTPTSPNTFLTADDDDDDGKINTLIILGVGTLLSILVICLFLLAGLIIFYKRKQEEKSKRKEVVHNVKDSLTSKRKHKKSETTESMESRAVRKSKSPRNSTETMTPSVEDVLRKSNKSNLTFVVEEDGEQKIKQSTNHASTRQSYVNQSQIDIHASILADENGKAERSANFSNGKIVNGEKIVKDYEVHGGFVMPQPTLYQEETNYIRYPVLYKTEKSTSDELHVNCSVQIPSVKSKSDESIEDPYVTTPPLKSSRCQQKPEKLDAYQKLMPNGNSQCDGSDDYNILLHNSSVVSQDTKALLALNNNLKDMSIDKKCSVTINSHCSPERTEITGFNW